MASSSSLPSKAFTLTGGCFCKSIRYSVTVPALESRPRHERPARKISATAPPPEELDVSLQHWPIISFDHCSYCRHITGSIIQAWLIFPTTWASWTLLAKDQDGNTDAEPKVIEPSTIEVLVPSEELKAKTHVSYFCSSEESNRIFCGKCGTGLTYYCDGEDPQKPSYGRVFDIALGTLDDECLEIPGVRPTRQGWHDSGISWVKNLLAEGDKTFAI